MGRVLNLILGIGLTLSLSANGSEGFITGKQLLKLCESPKVSEQATCYGYIRGLTETELANETLCLDPGITFQRTMDKSIEIMQSQPQFLHESAVITLVESLKEVHPCEHSEH